MFCHGFTLFFPLTSSVVQLESFFGWFSHQKNTKTKTFERKLVMELGGCGTSGAAPPEKAGRRVQTTCFLRQALGTTGGWVYFSLFFLLSIGFFGQPVFLTHRPKASCSGVAKATCLK